MSTLPCRVGARPGESDDLERERERARKRARTRWLFQNTLSIVAKYERHLRTLERDTRERYSSVSKTQTHISILPLGGAGSTRARAPSSSSWLRARGPVRADASFVTRSFPVSDSGDQEFERTRDGLRRLSMEHSRDTSHKVSRLVYDALSKTNTEFLHSRPVVGRWLPSPIFVVVVGTFESDHPPPPQRELEPALPLWLAGFFTRGVRARDPRFSFATSKRRAEMHTRLALLSCGFRESTFSSPLSRVHFLESTLESRFHRSPRPKSLDEAASRRRSESAAPRALRSSQRVRRRRASASSPSSSANTSRTACCSRVWCSTFRDGSSRS